MTKQEVHMLEAGCPLGTGETKSGSIGYWLKQEFTPGDKMTHEEGHRRRVPRPRTRTRPATRFYINLTQGTVPRRELHGLRKSGGRTRRDA